MNWTVFKWSTNSKYIKKQSTSFLNHRENTHQNDTESPSPPSERLSSRKQTTNAVKDAGCGKGYTLFGDVS
jgi:hypothetical protein